MIALRRRSPLAPARVPPDTALELVDVHAGYGDVTVLRGVTMRVDALDTVAVLGANGSGKSTLAKTIMGLTNQTAGQLCWGDSDISRLPAWRRSSQGFGYVPQVDPVFGALSVEDNLLLSVRDRSRQDAAVELEKAFEILPVLAGRRRQLAGNLSGGERRMLAVGVLLVQRPRLLVLDEPTSDLGPKLIDTLLDRVTMVRDHLGVPMVLVEQNVRRALEIATRVCVIARGRVVLDRPAGDVDEGELATIFLERR